eukprot:13516015-Ditylum_brightwellii.AAC.1
MMIHSALSEEEDYNDNVVSATLGGSDEMVSAGMFKEAVVHNEYTEEREQEQKEEEMFKTKEKEDTTTM